MVNNTIKSISKKESDNVIGFNENLNQNELRSSILQKRVDKITSKTDLTENVEV